MSAAALARLVTAEAIAEEGEAEAWSWLGATPAAVVRPESTGEVAALLAWAAAERVGVVPVGSGRHVGPARVGAPFVVLSTERLTGVERYEPADLTFTAGAGITLEQLDGVLGAHGQWLPADPPRRQARTLGGLVADGVSGPLAAGYGEIRDYVLGMTLVRGDGTALRLGGGVVKNVAGFDLLKPVIGSRGSLGVITSVCMRTFPLPAADLVLTLRAGRAEELAPAARALRTAPVVPASAVLVAPAAELDAGAALVVRLHGAPRAVEADRKALEAHASCAFEAEPDERCGEALALARDRASDAPLVLSISFLPSRLAEVLELCGSDRAGGDGLPAAPAGPAGRQAVREGVHLQADVHRGRLRVGVFPAGADDVEGEDTAFRDRTAPFVRSLRAAVEGMGGALRVERGPRGLEVGTLSSRPSGDELSLAAGLERVFDPTGVLWCRGDREGVRR